MPTFDSRGFPIYYETHGAGDGLPLLLIVFCLILAIAIL